MYLTSLIMIYTRLHCSNIRITRLQQLFWVSELFFHILYVMPVSSPVACPKCRTVALLNTTKFNRILTPLNVMRCPELHILRDIYLGG